MIFQKKKKIQFYYYFLKNFFMEKFAKISTKSEDKKLQKFYQNFQRLIDFIENRGIYVENSEFYDKKISEINEKISENFHEKYDKNAKNIIVKNFREII